MPGRPARARAQGNSPARVLCATGVEPALGLCQQVAPAHPANRFAHMQPVLSHCGSSPFGRRSGHRLREAAGGQIGIATLQHRVRIAGRRWQRTPVVDETLALNQRLDSRRDGRGVATASAEATRKLAARRSWLKNSGANAGRSLPSAARTSGHRASARTVGLTSAEDFVSKSLLNQSLSLCIAFLVAGWEIDKRSGITTSNTRSRLRSMVQKIRESASRYRLVMPAIHNINW